MKIVSALALFVFVALSHAVGIGPIGGGGTPPAPATATVYAADEVTFNGTVVNGANSVAIEITNGANEPVTTLNAVPNSSGAFNAIWFPPVDNTYTITAHTFLNGTELSSQTVAFVSVVRPDAQGKITGGGWYKQAAWQRKDTFGFVAQVLGNGNIRGNFEFQDHDNLYNFKSSELDWVYAPDLREGYFSGWCSINGNGSFRFFVHVVDNGEPGTSDTLEFNVYNSVTGALVYSYGRTLSQGNIQVHNQS